VNLFTNQELSSVPQTWYGFRRLWI